MRLAVLHASQVTHECEADISVLWDNWNALWTQYFWAQPQVISDWVDSKLILKVIASKTDRVDIPIVLCWYLLLSSKVRGITVSEEPWIIVVTSPNASTTFDCCTPTRALWTTLACAESVEACVKCYTRLVPTDKAMQCILGFSSLKKTVVVQSHNNYNWFCIYA